MDLPSEGEEIWRYSRIADLDLDRYTPLPASAVGEVVMEDLPADLARLVNRAGREATVVLSRNGGPATVLHPQEGLDVGPAGPEPLGGAEAGPPPALAGPRADIFSALNGAFVRVPWRAQVARGVTLRAPLVLVHWLEGEGAALFPRLEVEVGAGSSADVIEVIASPEDALLAVPLTKLVLAPGSRLRFGQVQVLGSRSWQVGNQVSRVSHDAMLRSITVAFGGDYARVRTDSVLEGVGGNSELFAAYFGSGEQVHDLRTVQHHAAPRSRSNLLFKGAVANRARSVYSGLIRVEKGAKGTNAFQTNRNLVLSPGAEAYSVPNLEIEDNDVRCSHASAVGPIDESQMFYLESRGVPTRSAGRLIALGFMDDVLNSFPVASLRPWLREALAMKLSAAGLGGAAP
ncbi:MAG TPA: Fe-S cluster assembly protein SufD [Acidimicrobiales bacterium]|nr:Fe-S cluster assembly protein SufD [Acidimicrobiales bacterium]